MVIHSGEMCSLSWQYFNSSLKVSNSAFAIFLGVDFVPDLEPVIILQTEDEAETLQHASTSSPNQQKES